MSNKDRVINLLTDEEVSYILTGLRLASRNLRDKNKDEANIIDELYSFIEDCEYLGVINYDEYL